MAASTRDPNKIKRNNAMIVETMRDLIRIDFESHRIVCEN